MKSQSSVTSVYTVELVSRCLAPFFFFPPHILICSDRARDTFLNKRLYNTLNNGTEGLQCSPIGDTVYRLANWGWVKNESPRLRGWVHLREEQSCLLWVSIHSAERGRVCKSLETWSEYVNDVNLKWTVYM